MIQNGSLILYFLLGITITSYIVFRAVDNKKKRIEKTKVLFNKINYMDLEIGLLEGDNENKKNDTENKD